MIDNSFIWQDIAQEQKKRIMRRSAADIKAVLDAVKPIIEDVREQGDAALAHYAEKFEGALIDQTALKVTQDELKQAGENLEENLKSSIKKCIKNVRRFHEEQMKHVNPYWMVEIEPGVMAGESVNPIESVGLYIPRGKGAFPSALYMLAIPALIAKVPLIAVVSPPNEEGNIDEATLYTARLCGIENIYKCGGAQAIAALAYGTKSVPKVKKVLGPGSPYVAAAKHILSDIIDPGMPAGPSESIILCDESVDLHNTCLDILNEAEHGNDSSVLLLTHNDDVYNYVTNNLNNYIEELPEPHQSICKHVFSKEGYGAIIKTSNLEESISVSNEYAPEHLHLKVEKPDDVRPKLVNAGEILIGEFTPSSLGNYGIGVNHVLPTGGWAHTYSCTSVWDFLKRTSLSRCDSSGFHSLKDAVEYIAEYEGFPAHKNVLSKRSVS